MQDLPHHYKANAMASQTGTIALSGHENLPELTTGPPPEFGGPVGQWSPETLLIGAVADCFVLSFRAIARASRLEWVSLDCEAEGVLDRVDGVTQFTAFNITARLVIPADMKPDKAQKLLHKAEKHCLITNSLKGESHLNCNIEVKAD